jgi:hypothetical protein
MMLVVTVAIGLAAGWTHPFEIVTGIVLLAIAGSLWASLRWLAARGTETAEPAPEIEEQSTPARECMLGTLLGFVLAGVVWVGVAVLRHTAVYGWFVDEPAEKLLEQADALAGKGSWQSVAELLKDPLPVGITLPSKQRIGWRRFDALLHIAVQQDDLEARCATLRQAVSLAQTYGFDGAGAVSGSAACDELLRARNVPQGSRLKLLAMEVDQSGRCVLRLRATDRSGAALGGLGPADFLVVSDGRRIGVKNARYEPAPNWDWRWVFVLDTSKIMAGARMRSGQMIVSFLAGTVRDSDESELLICSVPPARVAEAGRGGAALIRGVQSLATSGSAAILDAIWLAADDLVSVRHGAVVLITAGCDSASSHSLNEVQARLSKEHIPLYVIALTPHLATGDPLRGIAEATGGTYLSVRGGNLDEVRRKLGTRISGEPVYLVALAEKLTEAPVVAFAPREHPHLEAKQ